MSEFIRNDPIATRYAILYEFAKGKPIFETYQELCKTLKDNSFDYEEFEFWFMKFARKEFDVNYDRSFDPKCRSFSDLPVDIFNKLGDYLSLDDRYNLRTMSKNIQNNVDSWKPIVDDLFFEEEMSDQERLKYAYLLKNPKLNLYALEVYVDDKRSAELVVSVLKQVNHPVRVQWFIIRTAISEAATIISKLDSKSLECVFIRINDDSVNNMNELLQLEQIERLRDFVISTDLDSSKFPLQSFYNCSVFDICFSEVKHIKPIVSFIKKLLKRSTNLEKCRFCFDYSQNRKKIFKKLFSKLGSGHLETRRVSIPGTKDFYEVSYSDYDLNITRER
ncbi:hypothetical protein CRE_14971 [Caenorhabditis remanei]|uniref:F-box domain-containing protein n=1 Tax=Caenorhabditis remanei TaxID=31234 RepID=E3NF01_CAERE|nr:hypothetical protein CRE_14971 [Caenorhabditis remanei]